MNTVAEVVARAREAQRAYESYTQEQVDAVVIALAQTQDAAATDGDPGATDVLYGIDAVLVGAGGDDFRVVIFPGVQIVVVGGETGLLELLRLGRVEHPQGAADLHASGGDGADHFEHAVKFLTVANLPPGGTHAEACAAVRRRLLGGFIDRSY